MTDPSLRVSVLPSPITMTFTITHPVTGMPHHIEVIDRDVQIADMFHSRCVYDWQVQIDRSALATRDRMQVFEECPELCQVIDDEIYAREEELAHDRHMSRFSPRD